MHNPTIYIILRQSYKQEISTILFIAAEKHVELFKFCIRHNNMFSSEALYALENYWDFEQNYKLSAFKAVSIMNSFVRIHAYKKLTFFFFPLELNTSGPNFRIQEATKSFTTRLKNMWLGQECHTSKKKTNPPMRQSNFEYRPTNPLTKSSMPSVQLQTTATGHHIPACTTRFNQIPKTVSTVLALYKRIYISETQEYYLTKMK